ncbi:YccF domain-containing protein [Corynebacterium sp. 335C]
MKTVINFILNIIWLLTGGLVLALAYFLFGLLACIFIITIPAGVASFRIGAFMLWPFGRAVVEKPGAGGGSLIMNVIWMVVAGVWLAIGHVATAITQAITIIGLPMAWANLKLIPVTCFPFGKQIVDGDRAGGFVPLAR